MKKIILTICFCFIATVCSADHWVYIRLEDRLGVTEDDTPGRSKRGDIVDIRYADYQPSAMETKEYAIVKVTGLTEEDIREYEQAWEEDGFDEFGNPIKISKAYRKYRLKKQWIKNLSKGIFPNVINVLSIKNNIRIKVEDDLALYERKRKVYAFFRPFRIAYNYVDYAFEYWTMPAYAFATTTCADNDTEDREQICTVNWGSQDYDTLTLWEDAKDGDLVTDKQIRTAHLYNDDGDLTDALTIDGSTTNSTYFIKVSSPVGERHNGTDNGGATVTRDFAGADNASVVYALDDWCVIEWLIIAPDYTAESTTDKAYGLRLNQWWSYVRNNIIHPQGDSIVLNGSSNNGTGIHAANGSATRREFHIYNNIIYGFDHTTDDFKGMYVVNISYRKHDDFIYNNTVYGNDIGIETKNDASTSTDHNIYLANNVSVGNGTDFVYDLVSTPANYVVSDYNCSEDATATGANSLTTCSDSDFVTAGSDMHLASGAVPIDEGNDLGTTNGVNFDIDNRDRDAEGDTWDIGADEYVSAAVAFTPRVMIF